MHSLINRRIKNYLDWTRVKTKTNNFGEYPRNLKVRQIRWCRIGENIGTEEDGKNKNYTRPVLIVKICGPKSFFGVPLTSRVDKGEKPYYFSLVSGGLPALAILSQARTWDSSRLMDVIDRVDRGVFEEMKEQLGIYLGIIKKK